ncbi:divisome protein SepX/GlpR [Marmoricola sp. RAF53]|uniref:divisome protein SepX/GlpR n=1 Tax=Marmoricola sp. RAF53 TaxID=3233059 RepID=UPI003F989B63
MDLSAIIFVVLAIGWAAYLIPMALKHHDHQAMSRPVDTFSDSVRVLGRGATPATPSTSASSAGPAEPVRRSTVTLQAARSAARRRRRVLAVLLLALAAVALTCALGYAPWWATAIPATLVVAFLVTARLTVRAQQVRRAAPVQQQARVATSAAESSQDAPAAEVEPDLGTEDTAGLSRAELADAVAAPVLDEGGLWDPLPVTLPTYVNKARARRTVRTIEITAMTSSGHDAADSALAREAEVAAEATKEAAAEAAADAQDRRAAGA